MATECDVLDRLERMLEAATPGPWTRDTKYVVGEVPGGRPGGEVIGRMNPTVDRLYGTTPDLENAELIVAIRNAAPALIRLARAAYALDAYPTPVTDDVAEAFQKRKRALWDALDALAEVRL